MQSSEQTMSVLTQRTTDQCAVRVDGEARSGRCGFEGVEPIPHHLTEYVKRCDVRVDLVTWLRLVLRRSSAVEVLERPCDPFIERVVLGARLAHILGEPDSQACVGPESLVEGKT